MKQKEAGIYRSEHFHSAGSVHFLTGVDTRFCCLKSKIRFMST